MTSAQEPFLKRSDKGGVATLTLNRPDRLNTLSEGMLAAVQAELDGIAADRAVRVVVVTGAGRAFCAGHALDEMRANPTLAYQEELFATCSKVMQSIIALPQPVIAKVQGLATAAGCQLVATCDLAIAAEEARFATSGINVGLFCTTPGVALGRTVARKHALEMLLTGEFISAARAAEIGLINRAVPAGALDDAVDGMAARIAGLSACSVGLGKAAFYKQMEMGLSNAYEFAGREMARNMMTHDAAEGIDAFLAKRVPNWQDS